MTILNPQILNRPTLGTTVPLDQRPPSIWAWRGDLDVADTAALAAAWRALLLAHPASVVIDLAEVTFLDCAVLSVLVRANNDPATQLLLRGVPAHVERVLQVTGLGSAFTRTHPSTSPGPTRAA